MTVSKLYLVVPCFNESAVVDETVPRFLAALERLVGAGKAAADSRLLLVDDGSCDDTLEYLRKWEARCRCVEVLALGRNAGQQRAIVEGLKRARAEGADAVVTLDCDGQDDPEAIEAMVESFRAGCRVVYGVRNNRSSDTFLKRSTALLFYRVMRMLGSKVVYNHAEFRLMSAEAVDAVIARWREGMFLRGLLPTLGLKEAEVEYRRLPRAGGRSHYGYWQLLKYALAAVAEAVAKRRRSNRTA